MRYREIMGLLGLALLLGGCLDQNQNTSEAKLSNADLAALGDKLFHDKNLSNTRNQSCASCHNPDKGFIDARENMAKDLGVSLGDDGESIGTRNAPTLTYAALIPDFREDTDPNAKTRYIGGQFHDGRAVDLADQAGGPPLNPVEMAMPDKASVLERLQENDYYLEAFQQYFGEQIFSDVDSAYQKMTEAIAAFENSDQFATFDSKWDRYLKGEYNLSFMELTGKSVFFSPENSSCVNCHMLDDNATSLGQRNPLQTFTNFRYFNIGTPKNTALIAALAQKNPDDPYLTEGDLGLYGHPDIDDENLKGKFKTPTLRNIAVTAPYMHNGVFKDLRTVLTFYDFRGAPGGSRSPINPETGEAWAETDYPDTIDSSLLGQTAMSEAEIEGLECFLRLLTDRRYEDLLPTHRSDGSEIICH